MEKINNPLVLVTSILTVLSIIISGIFFLFSLNKDVHVLTNLCKTNSSNIAHLIEKIEKVDVKTNNNDKAIQVIISKIEINKKIPDVYMHVFDSYTNIQKQLFEIFEKDKKNGQNGNKHEKKIN